MRRATWVALPVLLVALAMGAWRLADDVTEEIDAAAGLALAMAELGRLAASGGRVGAETGTEVLDSLLQLQRARPLRHLRLQVTDEAGRLLLPPPPDASAPGGLAAAWPRWIAPATAAPQAVSWPLPRPGGSVWTVTLTTSLEAERQEAVASLLQNLAMLAALVAGLLLVMQANLKRALAPLTRLVSAITGIERADTGPVRALPPMPVAELDAVAGALRHLGVALDDAEAARRRLAQQVLNLQEDERARLARELHDEFGQRLTAMRVDAAWLARRLPEAEPRVREVLQGLADQCGLIQQDVRQVLQRLQPLGPAADAAAGETPQRLAALLQQLAVAWGSGNRAGLQVAVHVGWHPDRPGDAAADALVEARADSPPDSPPDSRPDSLPGAQADTSPDACAAPWPAETPDTPRLPHALALTLYRISQEALTNVARHAAAGRAELRLVLHGDMLPGSPWRIDWSVADDGQGLGRLDEAVRRGNGLAGLRERVWSHGADLAIGPGPGGTGLRLAAQFATQALPPPAGTGPAPDGLAGASAADASPADAGSADASPATTLHPYPQDIR